MRYSSFARARAFGRQSVGSHVAVYTAGVVAAVVLLLLLLLVPVATELLTTSGSVTAPAEDSLALQELAGPPDIVTTSHVSYSRRGLLPTVYRLRNSWCGPLLHHVYTTWAWPHTNPAALAGIVVSMWLLALFAAGALYWLEWSIQSAAVEVAGAIRLQIHDQAHRLGAGDLFVGQKSVAAELFTDKTATVRRALVAWWHALPHAAMFLALVLLVAFTVDLWLTVATILLATLTWRFFGMLRRRAREHQLLLADRAAKVSTLLLAGLEQNRALGNLPTEASANGAAFRELLSRHDTALLARETTASLVRPLLTLLVIAGGALILLLAGFNVLRDPPRLTLAELSLLATSLGATVYPIVRFEQLLARLPGAEEAAADVFNYLDRSVRVGQLPAATSLEKLAKQISLEHVTLADSDGGKLFDDVSLALPAMGRVVVFASDDATPLAFAGLLARFVDPAAGKISFDGRDIRTATIDSARQQVALILPDQMLISGTIKENIVGDDARFSPTEIIDALKKVHAYEFVQPLPEGLETVVGASGLTLSSGQALRLGLARVALRHPSAVVIAEPHDDLDQATAERVAEAVARVTADKLLVILARRLGTLRAAQRVLLLHEGRLLADGTHQELLAQNDLYRHLNYVRFNEFRDVVR